MTRIEGVLVVELGGWRWVGGGATDGGEGRERRKTGGEEGRKGGDEGGEVGWGGPLQLANVMSIYERSRTAGSVQGPV